MEQEVDRYRRNRDLYPPGVLMELTILCSGRSRCSDAGQGASPLGVIDELLLTFR
jgi:hypothetical protein